LWVAEILMSSMTLKERREPRLLKSITRKKTNFSWFWS
jgi:signal recognition particle GTPase